LFRKQHCNFLGRWHWECPSRKNTSIFLMLSQVTLLLLFLNWHWNCSACLCYQCPHEQKRCVFCKFFGSIEHWTSLRVRPTSHAIAIVVTAHRAFLNANCFDFNCSPFDSVWFCFAHHASKVCATQKKKKQWCKATTLLSFLDENVAKFEKRCSFLKPKICCMGDSHQMCRKNPTFSPINVGQLGQEGVPPIGRMPVSKRNQQCCICPESKEVCSCTCDECNERSSWAHKNDKEKRKSQEKRTSVCTSKGTKFANKTNKTCVDWQSRHAANVAKLKLANKNAAFPDEQHCHKCNDCWSKSCFLQTCCHTGTHETKTRETEGHVPCLDKEIMGSESGLLKGSKLCFDHMTEMRKEKSDELKTLQDNIGCNGCSEN